MPDQHPYPDIWQRLTAHVEANPTPAGEWRLIEGEHRLIGAVQHAQAEPECNHEPGDLVDVYRGSLGSALSREYRCAKCPVIFTVEAT